jgi:hypothetical protein
VHVVIYSQKWTFPFTVTVLHNDIDMVTLDNDTATPLLQLQHPTLEKS